MASLTKEQKLVIEARNCSLLVSAGAGAGKTHTLVERIINLISDESQPVDVDRLLVVTFTNAAAAEMRQRIAEALFSKIRKGTQSKHLRKQVRLLNKSSISTIHSFCLDVIRQHFHRLDIDPTFRIADELESQLIKGEVVEKLVERHYDASDNDDFLALVDCYGGSREDVPLQNIILLIYDFSRSLPWPDKWLEDLAREFCGPDKLELEDFPWLKYLKEAMVLELDRLHGALLNARELAQGPGGPREYLPALESDLGQLHDLLLACRGNWQSIQNAFANLSFRKLASSRNKEIDETLKKSVKEIRDGVKNALRKIAGTYFFKPPGEFLQDIRKALPLVKKLVELVQEFSVDYQAAKKVKGLVDFGDLEHFALRVLAEKDERGRVLPSAAARQLQARYVEVLVDEYQDINEVQETILKMVTKDGEEQANMLMVGDPKQSIYRFRLAEPSLFQSKQLSFSRGDTPAREQRVDLSKNFRSRENIINGVNFIFRQVMTTTAGEMEYDSAAELVYGANYPALEKEPDRSVELHLIDRDNKEHWEKENRGSFGAGACQGDHSVPMGLDEGTVHDGYQEQDEDLPEDALNEEIEEELEVSQLEARLIAHRIKMLMKEQYPVYDKALNSYRPIEYRDIVILLRATKGWANTFLEEFRKLNIPAYAELSSGYFEAVEVNTIMALLRIIDNPRQDIPLAAVLRSPVVGLTAEELALIKLSRKEGDYWDAVKKAARGEDALSAKLASFVDRLNTWRTRARRGSLSLLIWEIYRETGYFDYVGGLPGGTQRQANLRALYDRARQYESLNFRGVLRFLGFIEAFLEKGQDLGEARIMGEKENVVRIMSIHKSKGLEFPVVFVGGLGKKFNTWDLNRDILLHKKLGFGPELIDIDRRIKAPTLAKLAIRHKILREYLAEELRVLYVAVTRAREKLILVGSAKGLQKMVSSWCSTANHQGWQLPDGMLVSSGSFLGWLGPALIRHRDFAKLHELYPSGFTLRPDQEVYGHFSAWSLKVYGIGEFGGAQESASSQGMTEVLEQIKCMQPVTISQDQNHYADLVRNILSWKYPHAAAVGKPAVISVTEIKGRMLEFGAEEEFPGEAFFREVKFKKPAFLQEVKGLSQAEIGAVMHTVMQQLDLAGLKKDLSLQNIASQVGRMEEKEVLTRQEAMSVNLEQVYSFFQSELGQRLLAAAEVNKVKREAAFTLALPAELLYQGEGEDKEEKDRDKDKEQDQKNEKGIVGEKVLVRGIIDCLFFEDDGAVLLDFKTDVVNVEQLVDRTRIYKGQLDLYARAVEVILKKTVKEKHLYFLSLGESVDSRNVITDMKRSEGKLLSLLRSKA
ncbi:MAG: UvrD-helicase domain-containing protein [Bacillota bacterium]